MGWGNNVADAFVATLNKSKASIQVSCRTTVDVPQAVVPPRRPQLTEQDARCACSDEGIDSHVVFLPSFNRVT